jgi:hypothetical protein
MSVNAREPLLVQVPTLLSVVDKQLRRARWMLHHSRTWVMPAKYVAVRYLGSEMR